MDHIIDKSLIFKSPTRFSLLRSRRRYTNSETGVGYVTNVNTAKYPYKKGLINRCNN